MTYRIIHGSNVTRCDELPAAVVEWTRVVTAHPGEHATFIEGDELPGLPPKVIAERFGNPTETDAPKYVGPPRHTM